MDSHTKLVHDLDNTTLTSLIPEKLAPKTNKERTRTEHFVRTHKKIDELVLHHLLALPYTLHIPLTNDHKLLISHNTPIDPTTEITHNLNNNKMLSLITTNPTDIITTNNDHIPFVHDLNDIQIIDINSIDESPKNDHTHFTLITPHYNRTVIEQYDMEI